MGKFNVNTLSFTGAANDVTPTPGHSVEIPAKSKIALIGLYDQIERLQVEHGIIDPSAEVRHTDRATTDIP